MKLAWTFVAVLAIFGSVHCRELYEAGPGGSDRTGEDLSGTGLLRTFCEAKGKECRTGKDIAPESGKFAATLRQCMINCGVKANCLSAFYSADKTCFIRTTRCSAGELVAAKGTDYYRLKEGEKCPADRPLYVDKGPVYSNFFCQASDKACIGHNIYKKPQNIAPFSKCVDKCAKIKSCASVDYYGGKCEPKDYNCEDAELKTTAGRQNFMRLEKGVQKCPSNRQPVAPPGVTTPTPTEAPTKPPTTPAPIPVFPPGPKGWATYYILVKTPCIDAGTTSTPVIGTIDGPYGECQGTLNRDSTIPECSIYASYIACPFSVGPPNMFRLRIQQAGHHIAQWVKVYYEQETEYMGTCDTDNEWQGCRVAKSVSDGEWEAMSFDMSVLRRDVQIELQA